MVKPTRIAIKYCGGCNPEFDRAAAVAEMLARLEGSVEVVALDDAGVEVIAAVQGCRVSCADLEAYRGKTIVLLSSREDVERFNLNSLQLAARDEFQRSALDPLVEQKRFIA